MPPEAPIRMHHNEHVGVLLILLNAGAMCASCASGFYLRPDRTCVKCPEASGTSALVERLKAALPFGAFVVLFFGIVVVLLVKLERLGGADDAQKAWTRVRVA